MIVLAYVGPIAVLVLFAGLVKRINRSELGEDEASPDNPDTKRTPT